MVNIKKLDEMKSAIVLALQTIDEVKKDQHETDLAKVNDTLKALVESIGEIKDAII